MIITLIATAFLQACSSPATRPFFDSLATRDPASSDHRTCSQIGCDLGFCKFSDDAKRIANVCSDYADGCIEALCRDKNSRSFLSDFIHHAEACSKKYNKSAIDKDN